MKPIRATINTITEVNDEPLRNVLIDSPASRVRIVATPATQMRFTPIRYRKEYSTGWDAKTPENQVLLYIVTVDSHQIIVGE